MAEPHGRWSANTNETGPSRRQKPPVVDRGKKWTAASDRAADKRAGIKEGSKADNALDRKRGVPVRKGK